MSEIERAEADTRLKVSESDRRKYRGIAVAPLARAWLLKRFIEASDRAAAAKDDLTREKFDMRAERVRLEMRRLGMDFSEKRSCK